MENVTILKSEESFYEEWRQRGGLSGNVYCSFWISHTPETDTEYSILKMTFIDAAGDKAEYRIENPSGWPPYEVLGFSRTLT